MVCIPRVCDFHVHLRQDIDSMVLTLAMLKNHTSTVMAMLNVKAPHIQSIAELEKYAQLVEKACMYAGMPNDFEVYLCPKIYQGKDEKEGYFPTDTKFIEECAKWQYAGQYVKKVLAFKAYPDSGTTNSGGAITDFCCDSFREIMSALKKNNLALSVHSEMVGGVPLSAENIFFNEIAPYLVDYSDCPKIVFEHLSTATGVEFVMKYDSNVMATITPQHLLFVYHDVRDCLGRIIDPHKLCMPIAKMEEDLIMLQDAIYSEKFFYGSDTAPHPIQNKIGVDPAKGVFGAYLMPYIFGNLLRETPEKALDLEDFLCNQGRAFYGLENVTSVHELKTSTIDECTNPFPLDITEGIDGVMHIEYNDLSVGLPSLNKINFPFVLERM